jgi:hypothetical protein
MSESFHVNFSFSGSVVLEEKICHWSHKIFAFFSIISAVIVCFESHGLKITTSWMLSDSTTTRLPQHLLWHRVHQHKLNTCCDIQSIDMEDTPAVIYSLSTWRTHLWHTVYQHGGHTCCDIQSINTEDTSAVTYTLSTWRTHLLWHTVCQHGGHTCITEETSLVKMCIWHIKIGIALVLHMLLELPDISV